MNKLKKCNITRDKPLSGRRMITLIPLLIDNITIKYTLKSFRIKFGAIKFWDMNKAK